MSFSTYQYYYFKLLQHIYHFHANITFEFLSYGSVLKIITRHEVCESNYFHSLKFLTYKCPSVFLIEVGKIQIQICMVVSTSEFFNRPLYKWINVFELNNNWFYLFLGRKCVTISHVTKTQSSTESLSSVLHVRKFVYYFTSRN